MRPEQRGFALVAALFLMVVIALLVVTMSRLSVNQHVAGDLALQQARAYQAARAGLEWGIGRVRSSGACASGSLDLTGGPLEEFGVTLSCSQRNYLDEEGSPLKLFRLEATASNGAPGGRPDYAWRRLTATVER